MEKMTKKKDKVQLYLAHPILDRREVRDWELGFEKFFTDIDLFNPFYDSHDSGEERAVQALDNSNATIYYDWEFSKKIVTRDLNAVRRTEGTIAFLGGHSTIGTIMEICYAWNWGKPVFVIAPQTTGDKSFPLGNHPWIQYHSTRTFDSFNKFEDFIKTGGLKNALHKKR